MPNVKIYDFCGKVEKKVGDVDDDFLSSSPCIIPWSDASDPEVAYLLNVRYVNYYIEPNGGYKFKHDNQKITTINRTYWLDRSFAIRKEHWLDKVEKPHLRYQGVEDVKIFKHKDDLLFLGTVEDPETGNIRVGHGSYTFKGDRLASTPFQSPLNRGCEKNWCYVLGPPKAGQGEELKANEVGQSSVTNAAGELKVVYDWSPLTIGAVEGNNLRIQSRNASVPPFFQDLRGSTNGAVVGNERWFLCHIANYTTPRTYYHMIVVLDENLVYKRNTILFKFHDVCIEYALGLIVESDRMIITYSKMDRTSAILEMPRALVESELFA
jgi:hypothetical protein